jgi:hypothetical protein
MAVRLESSIRRWIGLSTDEKPSLGLNADGTTVTAQDLTPGSSFLETDTGRIYRWDGVASWRVPIPDDDAAVRHQELMLILGSIREVLVDGLA